MYYRLVRNLSNLLISFNPIIIKSTLFKYRKSAIALFVLVTIVILYGTLSPPSTLPKVDLHAYDKVIHFLMFAVWTFLYGLVRAIRKKSPPNLWMVFSLGLFYGILVEILQLALPTNRTPETFDFVADALGSGLAILVLKWIFKPKK